MDHIRAIANRDPIFFSNIFINFDDAWIERILSVRTAFGNPVLHVGIDVAKVCFVTAFERLKSATCIVNRLARFRVCDATNPSVTG